MKTNLHLSTNRFIPDHEVYSSLPYQHYSVKMEFSIETNYFDIDYRKETDEQTNRQKLKVYLYFEADDDKLESVADFLSREPPQEKGESDFMDLNVNNGKLRVRRSSTRNGESSKERYSIDTLRFVSKWDRLIIETFEGENPMIPFYQEEHWGKPQDRDNLEDMQIFADRVQNRFFSESVPDLDPVSSDITEVLETAKWGEEVIRHLDEGDKCFQNELLHPALNSYLHAIEWAIISYLAEVEELDVIDNEKDGRYYSFYGPKPSLVDELSNFVDIDQKMDSKLNNFNSAERRWSAHHKSGDETQEEIEAVRSRLLMLLEQLFSPRE